MSHLRIIRAASDGPLPVTPISCALLSFSLCEWPACFFVCLFYELYCVLCSFVYLIHECSLLRVSLTFLPPPSRALKVLRLHVAAHLFTIASTPFLPLSLTLSLGHFIRISLKNTKSQPSFCKVELKKKEALASSVPDIFYRGSQHCLFFPPFRFLFSFFSSC